ncbi:MAG: outer membrane protein OmpA-like peptidoglycan-associated protein [Planctomycetota bacterium]|jgi:outer membrane protein OmpA-like peptidoglycan-associated protein
MKNLLIILILAISIFNLQAEDTARVKVIVNNELGKPVIGEQIFFEDELESYIAKGVTNEEGIFYVDLLGGLTYNIKVKTVGEAEMYNTMKIPLLEEGQKYSENLLTITIYEEKAFTLDNVYFDSGNSNLKPESDKELNELFEYLSLKKDVRIQISGHTDNVGDEDANFILSENRSKSVQNYLLNKGIDKNRIEIKAFGETSPIYDNTSAAGRAKNRRIEVMIL